MIDITDKIMIDITDKFKLIAIANQLIQRINR